MSGILWVNDHDLEADLGLTKLDVTGLTKWTGGIKLQRNVAALPGAFAPAVAPYAAAQSRTFHISAQLHSSSIAARDSEISKLLDVFSGLCEFRFGDSPSKVLEGYLEDESVEALIERAGFGFPDMQIDLDVTCPDPRKHDRYVQSIGFGATRVAVPLGTLASDGVIRIMGSATNPTITLRDSTGAILQTLGFTISLASTDYLQIDLKWKTVTKFISGVSSDALSTWTSGSWDSFLLDPLYGSYELANWPTLEVSAGVGMYVYARYWRN